MCRVEEYVVMPKEIEREMEDVGMIMFIIMELNHRRKLIEWALFAEETNVPIQLTTKELLGMLGMDDNIMVRRLEEAYKYIESSYRHVSILGENEGICTIYRNDEEFPFLSVFSPSDRFVYYDDWKKIREIEGSPEYKFEILDMYLRIESRMLNRFGNSFFNEEDRSKYPECMKANIDTIMNWIGVTPNKESRKVFNMMLKELSDIGLIKVYKPKSKRLKLLFITRSQKRHVHSVIMDDKSDYSYNEFLLAQNNTNDFRMGMGCNKLHPEDFELF